jgi:hypothetical protein
MANSKEAKKETGKMKFNWFKKEKVENGADFEALSVVLPKSGKEMTLAKLVEDHDIVVNMMGYAHPDHMVQCNGGEMKVSEMVKKYNDMLDKSAESKDKKESSEKEEKEREASSVDGKEDQDIGYQKKENTADKAKAKENFEKVKNAPAAAAASQAPQIDLPQDMLARGKALFGK